MIFYLQGQAVPKILPKWWDTVPDLWTDVVSQDLFSQGQLPQDELQSVQVVTRSPSQERSIWHQLDQSSMSIKTSIKIPTCRHQLTWWQIYLVRVITPWQVNLHCSNWSYEVTLWDEAKRTHFEVSSNFTPRREMLLWPEVCCFSCINEQLKCMVMLLRNSCIP